MSTTQILILAAVLFVLALVLFIFSLSKDRHESAGLKKELDEERELTKELEKILSKTTPIHASYCVSDSDLMKYKSDKVMENAIRSKLALLVANDIISKLGSPDKTKDNTYEYDFRVIK